jgi:hypothetical protein
MARLVAEASLHTLLGTIRELETRLADLKRTANAAAHSEGIALPFPARSRRAERLETPLGADFESEFAADSQD